MTDVFAEVKKKPALIDLEHWSRWFWKVYPKTIKQKFAQQWYEDKGMGHIEQIIENTENRLGERFKVVAPNHNSGEAIAVFNGMEKSLLLFYIAAYLHDIGMEFPEIYESLSEYVDGVELKPSHIGEIIHDYHHYTSFIVLMELSCCKTDNFNSTHYLQRIKSRSSQLKKLHGHVKNCFKDFQLFKEIKQQDFFVILAILCLLHKEVKEDLLQSILSNFKQSGVHSKTIPIFHKWWEYFQQSVKWTDKIKERFSREESKKFPKYEDHEMLLYTLSDCCGEKHPSVMVGSFQKILLKHIEFMRIFKRRSAQKDRVLRYKRRLMKRNNNGDEIVQVLDLALVEALLQYGDKTDITYLRLYRKQNGYTPRPIVDFIEAINRDNQDGYICTTIKQRVISSWARFRGCRFFPVLSVKVGPKTCENNIDIVIEYLRLPGDDDIFRLLRYHNEKDFYDLDFLNVIRFHVPINLSLLAKKGNTNATNADDDFRICSLQFQRKETFINEVKNHKGLISIIKPSGKEDKQGQKSFRSMLVDNCKNKKYTFPYTKLNRKAIKDFSKNVVNPEKKKEDKVFHETGDMTVPASFEIMAVLNLFN